MATTNQGWALPVVGGSQDTWGATLNTTIEAIDTLVGTVTAAEIDKLDGVTSNIQTQLNAKAPTASPTFTGSVNAGDSIVLGSWTIWDSGGTLYFQYSGNNVFKIDSSGNITAEANVTAYGTV
jgi:hypothetical protein